MTLTFGKNGIPIGAATIGGGGGDGVKFEVVTELPQEGKAGIIYLLQVDGAEAPNKCEEYIWLKDEGRYEEFGPTTATPDKEGIIKFDPDSLVINDDGQLTVDGYADLKAKVDDLELFKFPNATIVGEPLINNGQIANFSTADYLMFPFELDVRDHAFTVEFAFTTSDDVTTQQNVIDSRFGIALAIKNGLGLMAVSYNGTSWGTTGEGVTAIQPNTTYYAKLAWNKLQYKTLLSTNGRDYVEDISFTSATGPFPATIFIGGGSTEALGHEVHPFKGTINLNKAYVYIDNQLIWQGMDDVGLATRLDVELSNITQPGVEAIQNIVGNPYTKTEIDEQMEEKQDKLVAKEGILFDSYMQKDYLPLAWTRGDIPYEPEGEWAIPRTKGEPLRPWSTTELNLRTYFEIETTFNYAGVTRYVDDYFYYAPDSYICIGHTTGYSGYWSVKWKKGTGASEVNLMSGWSTLADCPVKIIQDPIRGTVKVSLYDHPNHTQEALIEESLYPVDTFRPYGIDNSYGNFKLKVADTQALNSQDLVVVNTIATKVDGETITYTEDGELTVIGGGGASAKAGNNITVAADGTVSQGMSNISMFQGKRATFGTTTKEVGFSLVDINITETGSTAGIMPTYHALTYENGELIGHSQSVFNLVTGSNGVNVTQSGFGYNVALDGTLTDCQVVIETFHDSASGSGYRVWSDGYCEQYGTYSYNAQQNVPGDVTLMKAYRDTNYVLTYGIDFTISTTGAGVYSTRISPSQIRINNRGNATFGDVSWKTCGYLAEGEY